MNRYLLVVIIVLIFFLNRVPVLGSDWDDFRKHEFVLFTGRSIDQFISLPVDHIFVYIYRELDNSWHQIPFQIDERDDDKYYFEDSYNAIVDSADEFLFIAGDGGDYAPSTSWIDDTDSKQNIRYEIEMSDPLNPTNKKYVYFYISSDLIHNPTLPYYLNYIEPASAHSDTIKTAAYIEGHNNKGIPDAWMIADSTGVFGKDILDRQKARAKGKYKPLPFITVSYNLNENNLSVEKRQVKSGRIRIIRDITYKTEVSGFEIKVGTFRYRYYPDRIISDGASKKLESDYGVSLIRQSFDMNENSIGSLYNNIDNFDLLVDGIEDSFNEVFYPSRVMNWSMHSGNQGTVVILNKFTPPSNAAYQTYYHESLTNTTGDGTDDTGDSKSYGDVGILLTGDKIKGSISIPYANYFMPGIQHREIGSTIAYQAQNKISRRHTTQNYAQPAELAISLPDTSAPAKNPISVPVLVGNVNGLNILSTEVVVQFDTLVLQATGVNVVNTLIENWDPPVVTISNDTMFINVNGTTALQNSGVLIYLDYTAIGAEGQQSPLHFVRAKFNIWNPLALLNDGTFTTLAPLEVAVNIPNAEGLPGAEVIIPIKVADVTGLNITSCSLELKFDKTIIDALSISVEGTITSEWTNVNFTDGVGWVKIEMNDNTPLNRSGNLVWIKFKVVGNAGQSTTISFENIIFNEGVPMAKTNNGIFIVTTPLHIEDIVSVPDTTIKSESQLHIPVRLFTYLDFALTSYEMDLTFNHSILEFTGIDTNGTIPFGWSEPSVNYTPGNLSINSAGTTHLMGGGALIYLDFNVIGPDTSSTDIEFSKMSFNSGKYLPITRDGTVNVQGVVPVELSSFWATILNRDVKLEWTTATESNNFGFDIQRKTDNAAEWQSIGFVPGKGTTTIPQNYVFIDVDVLPGLLYYRLQQQDFDGKVDYSEIVEVNLLPDKFALYQNYPNPFNSSTTIKYELPVGEHQVRLMIYDLLGHKVRSLVDEDNQQAGAYQINWNGRDDAGKAVTSGVYFYRLQAGKQIFIKKMVLIQ